MFKQALIEVVNAVCWKPQREAPISYYLFNVDSINLWNKNSHKKMQKNEVLNFKIKWKKGKMHAQ